MEYVFVTLGIVVALVVAVIAYQFLKPRNDEFGGFREWVKNPDYRTAAADYFAARESLTIPDDISSDEIQEMVDRLFVQEDEAFNFNRLELVGAKAVRPLICALEDPMTASTKFGPGGHAFAPESPFERIVDLLEPIGPADAARPLAKYIDHEDDHFRMHAAIALGNIGTSECIAPMLKALEDDDIDVQLYAMMGIERGMAADRCTSDFLDAMFPALAKLLNRDGGSAIGTASELLLAIDAKRAIPMLLSPEYFTIENEWAYCIIRAMNAAGHKIPHDTLLPVLNAAAPLDKTHRHADTYAEALMAYAHNPDASAEQLFRAELRSHSGAIQTAAAEALAVLSGISNARKFVFDALNNRGFDRLSAPQKRYCAVIIYDSEVNNGGHAQYFVNPSGDWWKSALEGLKEIGANGRATILQKATALFGAAGPSVDNDLRHEQLAAFSARQDRSLDKLDNRYYSCDENIDALLALYTIKNKEHFTSQD